MNTNIFSVSAITDVGKKRQNNEDNFLSVSHPEKELILVGVADGMGGHLAGERASAIAVDTLKDYFTEHSDENHCENLGSIVQEINRNIIETARENPDCRNMGTTLTTAVLDSRYFYFAHIGDSRAYLVRNNQITQLSNDHSFVEEQVRLGILTPEEAENHPKKNVITRALGISPIAKPDTFKEMLMTGDYILLCSDGLSNMVKSNEILSSILNLRVPAQITEFLLKLALSRGAPDNVTMIVVGVNLEEIYQDGLTERIKKTFKKILFPGG